ncbi:MAG: Barstar (barnase inhibitor) [Lawsonibacter sp.]|nr:Barstar (barnase inhibitor) [Lawsonibacter sp.]
MERRKLIIDGAKFSTLEEFYDEMDRLLTRDLTWRTGHNLDAFNDLLRGGFGVHEYGEALDIHWVNAAKSRRDFGYFRNQSERERGQTLFDLLVEIIQDTDNSGHDCILTLEE